MRANMRCLVIFTAFFLLIAACKDEDRKATEKLSFEYTINFIASGALAKKAKKSGEIGRLQLSSLPVDDGIEVRGMVYTDIDIAFGGQSKAHKLTRDYVPYQQPPLYNMFTLPLHLRQRVAVYKRTTGAVQSLLQKIEHLEREIITVGKSLYPSFVALNVVNSGDYSFEGLQKQSHVAFAGKQFKADLSAVRREIDKRTAALKKSVVYQQDLVRAAKIRDFAETTLYDRAVAIYRRAHPNLKRDPQPFTPSFRTKGKRTSKHAPRLRETVLALSTLKQARLLLARTMLRLYEPSYLNYHFSVLGRSEKLAVAVLADDTHRSINNKSSVFRYRLRASSTRHGHFQLGSCDYDRSNRPLRCRTDLKPVGKGYLELVLKK